MRVRILGPVQVWVGDSQVPIARPRQRATLAYLLMHANQVVRTEALIEALWAGAAPASARAQVQADVSMLRRTLDSAGARGFVQSRPGGYVATAGPEVFDYAEFRRLVRQARDAATPDDTATFLRRALALWQGPALADAAAAYVAASRMRLEELRASAHEDLAEAELTLGRHHEIAAELPAIVAEFPLRESLRASLMLALYRCGRSAEALAQLRSLRDLLAEEHGLDPGTDIVQLERRILRGDRDLEAELAGTAPLPAQLPMDIRGFTGRKPELATLDGLLADTATSSAVTVAAVSGPAGSGKSTLAVHWAHRVRDRFPDGQLHVNLQGYDPVGPAISARDALRGFLTALGVAPQYIPSQVPEQTDLYRSLMSGRRMLVVLDNADSADQIRPLLPGSPGCFVLVTSRTQLPGLLAAQGARAVVLDVLSADESRDLLAGRLGSDRVAIEPAAVAEIIRWCAGLPLALSVAAAHGSSRPRWRLAAIAAELRESYGLLKGYRDNDPAVDVRAVFASSYRALSTPAAAMFRLLGLHPGPEIGQSAAASLAGVSVQAAAESLAELAGEYLVTDAAPGRYGMHDLLRAYAREIADSTEDEQQRRAAVRRVLDHYLHSAHTAALHLHPHRDPLTLDAVPAEVAVDEIGGFTQANSWFDGEWRTLLSAISLADATGQDDYPWRLAWTLTNYLDRQGHWHEWATAVTTALAAANRSVDLAGQAQSLHGLALAHIRFGQYAVARSQLTQALDLHRRLDDRIGQGHDYLNLALVMQRLDQPVQALEYAYLALKLFTEAGHVAGQGNALNTVGWYHAQLGAYHEAIAHCERALALQQRIDDRHEQAFTWDSIGYAQHHLGAYRAAADAYREAIELWRVFGDRYYEAETTTRLGDTLFAAGDTGTAQAAWLSALDTLRDLGHPDADEVRARLGRVWASRARPGSDDRVRG
ncbi:BTAD domain-containing putative transcriptional regulator [Hamadaea sp. NPDC051192]|uniref:AfsR/SARP family transcriptional regulator n=1 Tax=Hamadaea sp. NPDC051192 TaxID=3154940 RepID=UPI003416BB67